MHAVLEVADLKRPPEFMMGGSGIGSVTRTVAENSPAGTYVGDPIPEAIDPDTGLQPSCTALGGDDVEVLRPCLHCRCDEDTAPIVSTRQIVVAQPLMRAGTGPDAEPIRMRCLTQWT